MALGRRFNCTLKIVLTSKIECGGCDFAGHMMVFLLRPPVFVVTQNPSLRDELNVQRAPDQGIRTLRPQAAAWRQAILVARALHGGRSRPQPAAERYRVEDFDPLETPSRYIIAQPKAA